MSFLTLLSFVILHVVHQASGFGWLMDPVARASAWRMGFPTPRNYDDNSLWCGGPSRVAQSGGKCGVCGDPFTGLHENEAGGKYATGVIVKRYKIGQTFTAKVELTANHYGWMEFRICPNNDVTKVVSKDCLNQHVLQRADGKGTKLMVDNIRVGVWQVDLVLPVGMTCTQCVVQWKYHAGNAWGVDAVTGHAGMGFGQQMEFYGCSDVAIESNDTISRPTDQATFAPLPTNPPQTHPPGQTMAPVTRPPITKAPVTGFIHLGQVGTSGCKAINRWEGNPTLDKWCVDNCAIGACPPLACSCSGIGVITQPPTPAPTTTFTSTTTTTPTTTTSATTPTTNTTTPKSTPKPIVTAPPVQPVQTQFVCKAINLWAGNDYLSRWCADACARGNCPSESCECSKVHVEMPTTTTTVLPPRETQRPAVVTMKLPVTKVCTALSVWAGIDVFDIWCTEECNKPTGGSCPSNTCSCVDAPVSQKATLPPQTAASTQAPKLTTSKSVTKTGTCSSNGVVSGNYWNGWCQDNCDRGYCPIDYCNCLT